MEVVINHVVELVLPWGLLLNRPLRCGAGVAQVRQTCHFALATLCELRRDCDEGPTVVPQQGRLASARSSCATYFTEGIVVHESNTRRSSQAFRAVKSLVKSLATARESTTIEHILSVQNCGD